MRRPGRARLVSIPTRPERGVSRWRDAWWLSWAVGLAGLFGIGFMRLAIDLAREGIHWSIAPIALLYGLVAYYLIVGCLRRTSWLQARRVRRVRQSMSR